MFYYSDDGKTFPNKIQALDYNLKTNIPVYFYYYDDVYSNINWSNVPVESLDNLYKNQAQKIRDEYDYVILCYSGGYDSTNILETFYYNNIKLDKIVTTGPFSQDNGMVTDKNHNLEIYKNAFPYLRILGLDSITQIIDYTKELYKSPTNFSIFKYGDNWIEEIGTRFSPHNWFWRDLDKHVVPKEYQDKKIAIIWGTDKPRLDVGKDNLYTCFRDNVITSYGRVNQPFFSNTKHINFYWDPTYPLILIKQLDILKNEFLKNNRSLDRMSSGRMVYLMYNIKNRLNVKSTKTQSMTFSKRDTFLNYHTDSEIYKFYNIGINNLKKYDNICQCIESKRHIIYDY
jgi:hypothetical protein